MAHRSPIVVAALLAACAAPPRTPGGAAPLLALDLAAHAHRQTVVDRESGQYLGHPTTVLLEDGRTLLCVYPKGHGRGAIVMKRSGDGGRTWSERLPLPASFATSLETPTIHRVVDAHGRRRLLLWSGLHPARFALSEDDGRTWSELAPAGTWGGIVVMASLVPVRGEPGHYLAFFHDDGRFLYPRAARRRPPAFTLLQTRSRDGGRTWGAPEPILQRADLHLCEPGVVRSPDGRQLAMLLRENTRRGAAQLLRSDDEGRSWWGPTPLPHALAGDRHVAAHAPDGRLVVSFRDMAPGSPTRGDWVAWVGTYDDLVAGRAGRYRVRLMDNLHGTDCGYPGVEVLGDGTLVATSYGHWRAGEAPYVVSVRFTLAELDALAEGAQPWAVQP